VGQRGRAVAALSGGRPAAELLAEAYAKAGTDGVDAAIPQHFATALTRQVSALAPKLAVEIGMANGLSTLAILAGLPAGGKLISIDPFQDSQWHGAGSALVAQSDRAASHELRQAPDYLALPALLEAGTEVDFAYIDGMHTFDYVALDAFYLDKLLRVGGVLALNDCGFRSIHKFLRFFRSHRHYEEIDVGLPSDFTGGNPLITLLRRFEGRSNQDRYFRKLDRWEGEHNYFRRF
jgi:predicted O-methyltransferase YrrM